LDNNDIEEFSIAGCSLDDIGLTVSTGPVIDFRVKDHLREMPAAGTAPLLYPGHFSERGAQWPKDGKKPNAILSNAETQKWLYPNGYYCVVRRFSSKDEYFHRFNGHTQINATDLKTIKYPRRDMLNVIGKWALRQPELTQEIIDDYFGKLSS